jgi:hypothetical protein
MDARQAREIGEALAFLIGDRRDTPLQCGWPDCRSEDLWENPINRHLCCNRCGRETSMFIAHEQREQRAREKVMSGVGGPLVQVYGKKR